MLPLLRCFFAHLLILQYPDHHQNLISSYLYYSGPVHKISSQSVHNFLSNVVHRQTNKQTNQRYQKHNLLCQGGNYSLSAINRLIACLHFRAQRNYKKPSARNLGVTGNACKLYVNILSASLSVSRSASALPEVFHVIPLLTWATFFVCTVDALSSRFSKSSHVICLVTIH